MHDETSDGTASGTPTSGWRIVGFGAVALAVLYVAGAVVNVPRIERDLQRDIARQLTNAGIVAAVELSGQDATLRCGMPLPDPDDAVRSAQAVDGVHDVALDASCGSAGPGGSPTTAASSATAPPATVPPATVPPATVPPDTAPPTTSIPTTTVVAPTSAPVVAVPPMFALLSDGRLTLSGTVASEAQHQALVSAVAVRVHPANTDDRLVVDATSPIDDGIVTALASVVSVMSSYLVSGEVGWDGATRRATGVYTNGLARAAFEIAANAAGVTATLSERAPATPADAAGIETALNNLVSAEPVLFTPGTADITSGSQATLQKVAGIAKRFGGLRIEVRGHTDSLGTATENQQLSERRAGAVVAALESYGVPSGDLVGLGFGETQLILDANGREIPEQSRRVVFGVSTV